MTVYLSRFLSYLNRSKRTQFHNLLNFVISLLYKGNELWYLAYLILQLMNLLTILLTILSFYFAMFSLFLVCTLHEYYYIIAMLHLTIFRLWHLLNAWLSSWIHSAELIILIWAGIFYYGLIYQCFYIDNMMMLFKFLCTLYKIASILLMFWKYLG